MTIDTILNHASNAMTVVSLATFIGILWWAYSKNRRTDFATAAHIPFDDEYIDNPANAAGKVGVQAAGGGQHV